MSTPGVSRSPLGDTRKERALDSRCGEKDVEGARRIPQHLRERFDVTGFRESFVFGWVRPEVCARLLKSDGPCYIHLNTLPLRCH